MTGGCYNMDDSVTGYGVLLFLLLLAGKSLTFSILSH